MVARKAKLTDQIEAELQCSMPLTFEEQVSNWDHKTFSIDKAQRMAHNSRFKQYIANLKHNEL